MQLSLYRLERLVFEKGYKGWTKIKNIMLANIIMWTCVCFIAYGVVMLVKDVVFKKRYI